MAMEESEHLNWKQNDAGWPRPKVALNVDSWVDYKMDGNDDIDAIVKFPQLQTNWE